jgi:hypothetical protein
VGRTDRREATSFRCDYGLESIPTQGALLIDVGAYFLNQKMGSGSFIEYLPLFGATRT